MTRIKDRIVYGTFNFEVYAFLKLSFSYFNSNAQNEKGSWR